MVFAEKCPPFWLANNGRCGSVARIVLLYSANDFRKRWFKYTVHVLPPLLYSGEKMNCVCTAPASSNTLSTVSDAISLARSPA